LIVTIIFLSINSAHSVEVKPTVINDAVSYSGTFEYTKKIISVIRTIKDLTPDQFYKKIDHYRSNLEKYFLQKKKVCNGEFSTIILSEGRVRADLPAMEPRKLSREERELCFREMKALQLEYINNMFLARKNYLDFLHERRVAELLEARETSIKSLQSTFSKRERKRKRRRRK
jgi:hypothetical protein